MFTKLFGVIFLLIAHKVYKAENASQKLEGELEESLKVSLKDGINTEEN